MQSLQCEAMHELSALAVQCTRCFDITTETGRYRDQAARFERKLCHRSVQHRTALMQAISYETPLWLEKV